MKNGTFNAFETFQNDLGPVHALTGAILPSKWRAIAVRRHPIREGWTVDLLPALPCIWECAVDGPFETVAEAKQAALTFLRAEQERAEAVR